MGGGDLIFLRSQFEAKVKKAPSGCWHWLGTRKRDSHPYGIWYISGIAERRAHRVAWRIYRGQIPAGMCVLHDCDVPYCVNPAHLFLGTHGDNSADRDAKGRTRTNPNPRGEKNGRAKLTTRQVAEIRASNEPGTVIGPRLGVSPTMVYYIRKHLNWKEVRA